MAQGYETALVCRGDVEACLRAWVQAVFLDGGGLGAPTIEEPGEGPYSVGCLRRVALRVREKIFAVTEDAAAGSKTVEYRVVESGFGFPGSNHVAYVTFSPAPPAGEEAASGDTSGAGPQCRVVWHVDYDPYFGCSLVLRGLVSFAVGKMLRSLRFHLERDS